MAKSTKTPAKASAKAPTKATSVKTASVKSVSKPVSAKAASAKAAPAKATAAKPTLKASAKASSKVPAKSLPQDASPARATSGKVSEKTVAKASSSSSVKVSSGKIAAKVEPVKASSVKVTPKTPERVPPARPVQKIPAKPMTKTSATLPARIILPPRDISDKKAPEEFEDAFSDVPQEPEQFSPVPMASRLQRTSVRYSDEDLTAFRKHIEAERKKAMEEFQILRENLEDLTNSEMADENASYSMHMAEQGTDAQEKEKLYAHVQRVSDYIKKLDEALQRIDDKVYGICKMCGILIAKERLLAVPITTQSASYKLRKRCPEDGIDRIVPVKR